MSDLANDQGFLNSAVVPNQYGLLYFPIDPPAGADFMDTQQCHCALRTLDDSRTNAAWRCLGNQTTDVYEGSSGKWFWPSDNSTTFQPNVTADSDFSNPPDLNAEFSQQLDALSIFDDACNGINNTAMSSALYTARAEANAGQAPISIAPCWRPGVVPLPIEDANTWQQQNCSLGFFCPNNTINALPQYCTPLEVCLEARLTQSACRGIGMGMFEPAACSAGDYCPPGGKEKLQCPQGYYCPPGTAFPIKCDVGAWCPAGSQMNQGVIPVVILVVMDILLIVLVFLNYLRNQHKLSRMSHHQSQQFKARLPRPRGIPFGDFKERNAGYKSLKDDSEMITMEPTVYPQLRHVPMSFQAALNSESISNNVSDMKDPTTMELRAFVESLSKCIQNSNFGLSFGFSNLCCQPKGSARPILSGITGDIASGTLVGVMGGSGAGKSTFVNVLMGKTKATSGVTKVNGAPAKVGKFKKIIGYVPQDDIVLPELTVRENILHSARIRLPSRWSNKDIQKHTDSLIDCLELTHVSNSRVGSVAKPVISGGQRKRVSIGMELAAAPMALFLDEPTSGLDATAALSIMTTLKALSRLGITVISIIHQPRQEIFEALDDLILLANGRMIYQGKEEDVQKYFEQAGFHFPRYSKQDAVTDIITGGGRPYKKAGEVSKEALIDHWSNTSGSWTLPENRTSTLSETQSLRRSIKMRGAPWYRQLWFCLMRATLQQWRTKSSFWFEMGVAALAGFLIGLAENSRHGNNFVGLYSQPYEILSSAMDLLSVPIMALLVAISIGLIVSSPGVKVFGEETLVYRRESASGHSSSAYYLGKVFSTFPRIILGCFHFTTLFMLLATPLIPWPKAFAANILYFYCIYGLASIVSMLTRREDGPLLAVMASLIVGVLSGFAPRLAQVSQWHMTWLWRASPGTWISELYFSENTLPTAHIYQIDLAAQATGFVLGRFAQDCLVLLLIGCVYRVVAFAGLVVVGRMKKK